MSEAEWRASSQVICIVNRFGDRLTIRKLRLFGIACCRRVQHLLTSEDAMGRQALDLAEQMVEELVDEARVEIVADRTWNGSFKLIDGFVQDSDLNARSCAISAAYQTLQFSKEIIYRPPPPRTYPELGVALSAEPDLLNASRDAAFAAAFATGRTSDSPGWIDATRAEEQHQIKLVHEIFGPFPNSETLFESRGATFVDETAIQLARTIYDRADFDVLPILADALESAGCTNNDILRHCREPGEHVRGCWVVDLVLGKT